ncbi:TPA: hypothetical protein ACIBOM_004846 [Salmonella enterica subsp. enterica serovar Reading]|nr:hypothetical protein [Salmonella enterica]
MDNAAGKRILEYILRRQPVKLKTLLSDLGISKEDYYAATLLLRHEKKIIKAGKYGIFAGEDAYMKWLNQKNRNKNK